MEFLMIPMGGKAAHCCVMCAKDLEMCCYDVACGLLY